jgi:putative ABC transport system ATP-binding protein
MMGDTMNETHSPIIAVEDLTFHYREGDFHLHIPELRIDAGTKIAIIGPSGSGKTTLINLLAGIMLPVSGRVSVHGFHLEQLNDMARRRFRIANVGFVFQDFALMDYLSVLDNILYPYRINRTLNLTPQVREHAVELAATMHIDDKIKRHIHHLSQGEKQRAAICRALVTRPPILLADEPTGNLDPANKAHILDLLFQYVDEHRASLIAVTHDHGLLSGFDQVIDFDQFHRGKG